MTPETALKHAIKDYLNFKGIFNWYNLQGIGSYKGMPDIFALKNGFLYAIEVKTPTGRVSDYQKKFLEDIEKGGGIAIVARNLDDVMSYL